MALVRALSLAPVGAIVVVDDGSDPGYEQHFESVRSLPKVHILRHAVNLGKGAALKNGINYILCSLPENIGIITADADGQHHLTDILGMARLLTERPDCPALGIRAVRSGSPMAKQIWKLSDLSSRGCLSRQAPIGHANGTSRITKRITAAPAERSILQAMSSSWIC